MNVSLNETHLKVLLQSASLCLLYPYLNLHMVGLGLTTHQVNSIIVITVPIYSYRMLSFRQVATTSSLLSLLDMVVPLVTGTLADMSGNFRCTLSG